MTVFDPALVPGDDPTAPFNSPVSPYSAWPSPADVGILLASAGIVMKLLDPEYTQRLQDVLDAVTADIALSTHRQFIADTADTTRNYDGSGTAQMEADEMVSLTSVSVIGLPGASSYTLGGAFLVQEQMRPQTRIILARGSSPAWATDGGWLPEPLIFPNGRQNISVTGRFGYAATVPADLWQAAAAEAAYRAASEAIFDPAGRVSQWVEGEERESHALPESADTQWHSIFTRTVRQYRLRPGRRFRLIRTAMI